MGKSNRAQAQQRAQISERRRNHAGEPVPRRPQLPQRTEIADGIGDLPSELVLVQVESQHALHPSYLRRNRAHEGILVQV